MLRSLALVALLAGLAAGTGRHAARAESEPSVQPWRVISLPRAQPQRAAPQTYRPRRRYDRPGLAPAFPEDWTLGLVMPPVTAPDAGTAGAAPAIPDSLKPQVLVIGDSLADALVAGFEADPAAKADLLFRHKSISASGLVRGDYHDWPKTLAALLAETPKPAALVVMLGLNDRQPIRAGDQTLEPLSEPWRDAYRKRIDAIIDRAQQARVPLVWVGLPVMRSPRLSAELAMLNEMIRERVTAVGETFVETFDGFSDQAGGFTASGPDIIGDIVRLRGPDGIHFSPAGQRKLAFFVEKPLRRRLGDRPGAEPQPAMATLPVAPGAGQIPAVAPPPLPAPAIRLRDPIGEMRPLSPPASAATLTSRRSNPPADPATRDLFDRGLAPEPRPGRADDFRWR
ncbi:MAG: DUF459 domain-containing protein [Rhabdaerophilum calidifontis]